MSEFEKYKTEAAQRWSGTDAYKEYSEKTKGYSKDKWNGAAEGLDNIMAEFALCKSNGNSPESEKAQVLVKKLQGYITENFYHCTDEILSGLGQMYVCDERFKKNIDKHAEGTAQFICDTIGIFCKAN